MRHLELAKPLAVFDIESTGTNPRSDRIIDLAIVKLMPDGSREEHTFRVDPGIPIPRETTEIHGISDLDVLGKPSFGEIAEQLDEILSGCDLSGYNAIRFDIPMLAAEMDRAGRPFSLEGRNLIDPQRIFHQREPRDLSAALQFYCGDQHTGAHGALDDVQATIRVLEGQLERYPDLPLSAEALHKYCNPKHPHWVDSQGRLRWVNGEVAIGFGKNQGRLLKGLVATDNGFLNWILQNDFPDDTKAIIRNAIQGTYPDAPSPEGA